MDPLIKTHSKQETMDRREFLKQCYKVGGFMAIIGLGLSAAKDAMAWGILPGITTAVSSGGFIWSNWDARTEDGIDSESIFAIFGEGGNGANEIGLGGNLSTANRTWTQNGAIPGSGIYRTLDGATQWFDATTGWRDFFNGATKYGLMFKMQDWNPGEDYEAIIKWAVGSELVLRVDNGTPRALQGYVDGNLIGTTADGLTTAGVIYCYLGCNGADTMVGFTSVGSGPGGQPTKLSDFAATKRALRGATTTMPAAMTEADPDIFRDSTGDNRHVTGKWHWAVACNNDPLIDFGA
jgi:hypothetical protein